MNARGRLIAAAASAVLTVSAAARDGLPDLPGLPFLGASGAMAGAGALTGGDASGWGGDNPAAVGADAPEWSIAAAGYAPFGLEDLHVAEAALVRAGEPRAAGFAVRALLDEAGPDAGRWTVRAAWTIRGRARAGLAVRGPVAAGAFGVPGGAAGVLWSPHPAFTVGAVGSFDPPARAPCAGLGADAGGRIGAGYELRVVVDHRRCPGAADAGREWRAGARLRLHASLSVHAGYAPRPRTAGLGIRFGLGDWDVFTALRRHAALGSTAVQGARWTRTPP